MISFIVIGRNEGKKLGRCFKTIRKSAYKNGLKTYEIVYVDSDSEDNSIEIAYENDVNQILKLEKNYNAAIARNVGAKYSKFDILMFLDGDMILKQFNFQKSKALLDQERVIKGKMIENIYSNGKLVKSYNREYPKGLSGGAFLVTKRTYNKVGGMDEKIVKGQDYDFFIRTANEGYSLVSLNDTIFEHDTISYRAKSRIKNLSLIGPKYRGYLLRKNFLSLVAWKMILREFYPLGLLIFLVSIYPVTTLPVYYLLLPISAFILTSTYKTRKNFRYNAFIFEIFRQLIFLGSLLFYYPEKKNYIVKELRFAQ